jgi:hypothetical protein
MFKGSTLQLIVMLICAHLQTPFVSVAQTTTSPTIHVCIFALTGSDSLVAELGLPLKYVQIGRPKKDWSLNRVAEVEGNALIHRKEISFHRCDLELKDGIPERIEVTTFTVPCLSEGKNGKKEVKSEILGDWIEVTARICSGGCVETTVSLDHMEVGGYTNEDLGGVPTKLPLVNSGHKMTQAVLSKGSLIVLPSDYEDDLPNKPAPMNTSNPFWMGRAFVLAQIDDSPGNHPLEHGVRGWGKPQGAPFWTSFKRSLQRLYMW